MGTKVKGCISLKTVRAVEFVDDHVLDNKDNVFQVYTENRGRGAKPCSYQLTCL